MAQEGNTNSFKGSSKKEAIKDPQADGEEWIGCRQWWGCWGWMGRSSLLKVKLQSTEFPSSKLLLYVPIKTEALKGRSPCLPVHSLTCSLVWGIYEGHLGEVSSSRVRPQSFLFLFPPSSSSLPPCLPPPTPPPPPSPSSPLCYRHRKQFKH